MFDDKVRELPTLRWAMVGGGKGSQIGYAHRCGATRDGLFRLVAGAFDIDPQRGREFGVKLGVLPERCYDNYQTMFALESKRDDGINVVSIATPNSTHYEITKCALLAGIHVVCEKPVTFTLKEAEELKAIAKDHGLILGVMYGYSGFQMVHQARSLVQNNLLGEIRVINMQFAHGFHSQEVELNDPGAKWRMNPNISGPTYVLGDIGTHAFYLGQLITGLAVKKLCCSRQSFVKSRAPLEDNAHVMMHFENGAVGMLWASAVNAGSMHQQKIRVVGENASIEWWDERPNQLIYEEQGKPSQVLERGMGYLDLHDDAISSDRIGAGHAEGFFESWANVYARFAVVINAANANDWQTVNATWFPDVDAGIEGVRWLERCVESADNDEKWVAYRE
ncbi:Gfo/Idh/MocA family protein [Marinomonas mediterranea]|uniref:Gfo/Idh/MocA family protein n=1 Tax=Marinomonas mediterranea TaxID=119864 RepID=UPI00234A18F7|nr:Gfo/Idh/MocA family oxidoreductase [Marinomonas mediterranea]WCN09347.1 Gfo/Idh/MocA family oxidoreductase [Marinomonas mediterranea]